MDEKNKPIIERIFCSLCGGGKHQLIGIYNQELLLILCMDCGLVTYMESTHDLKDGIKKKIERSDQSYLG